MIIPLGEGRRVQTDAYNWSYATLSGHRADGSERWALHAHHGRASALLAWLQAPTRDRRGAGLTPAQTADLAWVAAAEDRMLAALAAVAAIQGVRYTEVPRRFRCPVGELGALFRGKLEGHCLGIWLPWRKSKPKYHDNLLNALEALMLVSWRRLDAVGPAACIAAMEGVSGQVLDWALSWRAKPPFNSSADPSGGGFSAPGIGRPPADAVAATIAPGTDFSEGVGSTPPAHPRRAAA